MLFCPKCGRPLTASGSTLVCESGAMTLSPKMERGLRDVFEDRSRSSEPTPRQWKVGAGWFCPGCGVPMHEEAGTLSCAKCGESLDEFLFPLIELHPHRSWP